MTPSVRMRPQSMVPMAVDKAGKRSVVSSAALARFDEDLMVAPDPIEVLSLWSVSKILNELAAIEYIVGIADVGESRRVYLSLLK